jgi:ssDNA-binding Zn-finger/Zn-ribbon topoisomerase 1
VAGGFIEEFKEEVKGGIKSRMRWKEYEHDMVICPKCGTAQNRFIEPEWLK